MAKGEGRVYQYQQKIEEINKTITNLKEEKTRLIQEWAREKCPVKVGDVVTVNGFSYTGKRMLADNVTVRKGFHGWEWLATGKVLKKDGALGANRGKWGQGVADA